MEEYEELVGHEAMTLDGLKCWYKREIAKYGMITLAHAFNKKLKVIQYIISLFSLYVKLIQKIETVENMDTKNDLQIMAYNTNLLLSLAFDNFNIDIREVNKIKEDFGVEISEVLNKLVKSKSSYGI